MCNACVQNALRHSSPVEVDTVVYQHHIYVMVLSIVPMEMTNRTAVSLTKITQSHKLLVCLKTPTRAKMLSFHMYYQRLTNLIYVSMYNNLQIDQNEQIFF